MSSNGPATRLPPLSARLTPPANSPGLGSQASTQHAGAVSMQSFAHDRKPVGQHRPDSPTSPRAAMAENVAGGDRRHARAFGVHSILNPAKTEEDESRSRRRSAAQMIDSAIANASPPTTQLTSRPSSSGSDGFTAVSPTEAQPPRHSMHRRILTPLSPRAHPAAMNSSRRNPGVISTGTAPTGTIDAHQSPFLGGPRGDRFSGSHYSHAGNASSGPHFHSDLGHRYSLPHPISPPLGPRPVPRRQSVSSVVHTMSASPGPTYNPYSRNGHESPYSSGPSPRFATSSLDSDQAYGIPVVSTGQSSYQLLTIDSANGPVQLPVEVQAASRMADEKRKRNAGASARFRARRKEKERESSSKIQDLETQLRDTAGELDWYRKERDDLIGILRALPGSDRYLSRAKSPKAKRGGETERPGPVLPQPPSQSDNFSYERDPDSERNIRRRTEPYAHATTSPPPATLPYIPPGSYQILPPPSRERTPLQPYGQAASSGPPSAGHSRTTDQFDNPPRPLDPSWPPRSAAPR